ncbi:MAG: prepilin-type N-terminal cleavage/methylation domain-containing protein [Thermodesulfobacteriota bacterium]|nr:prepilin-type N-terminal cleavage/methylation domain-containing protein [Thermodesulfobacteriota bacterium]
MITLRSEYRSPGFSLIEMMVTLAIIGILVAVATPAYFNHLSKSRQTKAISTLMEIKAAQEIYFVESGTTTTNISLLPGFTTAGTYYIGKYYKYEITATGTMRAYGDLNGDGNFYDCWEVTRDMDRPREHDIAGDEGFSFGGMLGSIF